MTDFELVNAAKYFKGLPHQVNALDWLQSKLEAAHPDWLEQVAKLYRQPDEIRLDVPYYPQTDNFVEPERTCNSSCCAMAAKFLGASIGGDDEYLEKVLFYGDTTDHLVQTKALEHYGIKSQWLTNLDFVNLDKSLEDGLPMVLGILHRGLPAAPTGGHMIVLIGRTSDRNGYIFHDPYGSLNDQYTGPVENGRGVVYSKETLRYRWTADGLGTGWGRTFYGNHNGLLPN